MKTSSQFTEQYARYLLVSVMIGLMLLLQSCYGMSEQTEKTTPVYIDTLSRTPTASPLQTITPSKALSPTETPLFDHMNPTPTKAQSGTIYVFGGGYGFIPVFLDDGYTDFFNWYDGNNSRRALESAVNLAFSPYSSKVAYVNRTTANLRELWIASLDLSDARSIWTDSNNILDYSPDADKQVITLRWGPGEKFVIVSLENLYTKPKVQKSIVVDLQSQLFWETTDRCDYYDGVSGKKSGAISLFCKLLSGGYLVIESDGTSQKTETLPASQKIAMKEWSLSPNGDGIVYATEQNDVFVHYQGSNFKLPMGLGELLPISFVDEIQPLQWSRDGSRLLIWGDGDGCHDKRASCWQVLDVKTKKLLWADDKVYGAGPATLSPDGKLVLRFKGGTAMDRGGEITDINTNSTVFFIKAVFEKITWVK